MSTINQNNKIISEVNPINICVSPYKTCFLITIKIETIGYPAVVVQWLQDRQRKAKSGRAPSSVHPQKFIPIGFLSLMDIIFHMIGVPNEPPHPITARYLSYKKKNMDYISLDKCYVPPKIRISHSQTYSLVSRQTMLILCFLHLCYLHCCFRC